MKVWNFVLKLVYGFFNWFLTNIHGLWILLYMAVYMVGFSIIERAGHVHFHIIHTWIDDQIPFLEIFIIPYLLWFLFQIVLIAWFVHKAELREYYRLIAVLMMGMTLFIVVSMVYPNKLDLRPAFVDTSTFCGRLVGILYETDTPTNVLPSIHVYNTLVLCFALTGNERFRRNKAAVIGCDILGALIVLSTMFLKQHSVIDVALGIAAAVAFQMIGDRIFETDTERSIAENAVRSRDESPDRVIS